MFFSIIDHSVNAFFHQALEWGFAQDALVDMTGAVSEMIQIRSQKDLLWQRMLPCNNKDLDPLLAAGILSRISQESELSTGLWSGHAYAITAVKEIYDQGKSQSTIVQESQELGRKYWATRLSIRSFACTVHSYACSALLALLVRSTVLISLLTR